jgi:membrane protease YdiL (CAAX protease family)
MSAATEGRKRIATNRGMRRRIGCHSRRFMPPIRGFVATLPMQSERRPRVRAPSPQDTRMVPGILDIAAPAAHRAVGVARVALRTLLALLLGAIAVFGAIALIRKGVVPLVDALFQPGPAALSAVRRTGIFVAALGGYAAYVRLFERRLAAELRPRLLHALLGGAGGASMIGLPIALLFALGAYQVVLFRGASPALWGVAALILIAAMLEELVYRALLLRVLERAVGTGVALVVQALVFALAHVENLVHGSVADIATMLASVTVLGLLWGGLFVLSRNLWVGVAHHAAWNFTIMLSGVPLSGIEDWRVLAPLQGRYAGPAWLTGGQFGPESSWLVIAAATLAMAWLLRVAQRRGRFRRPGA